MIVAGAVELRVSLASEDGDVRPQARPTLVVCAWADEEEPRIALVPASGVPAAFAQLFEATLAAAPEVPDDVAIDVAVDGPAVAAWLRDFAGRPLQVQELPLPQVLALAEMTEAAIAEEDDDEGPVLWWDGDWADAPSWDEARAFVTPALDALEDRKLWPLLEFHETASLVLRHHDEAEVQWLVFASEDMDADPGFMVVPASEEAVGGWALRFQDLEEYDEVAGALEDAGLVPGEAEVVPIPMALDADGEARGVTAEDLQVLRTVIAALRDCAAQVRSDAPEAPTTGQARCGDHHAEINWPSDPLPAQAADSDGPPTHAPQVRESVEFAVGAALDANAPGWRDAYQRLRGEGLDADEALRALGWVLLRAETDAIVGRAWSRENFESALGVLNAERWGDVQGPDSGTR